MVRSRYDFARVHVRAGASVEVTLTARASELTQVGRGGVRRAWAGRYTASFGVPEAREHGQGFATHSFVAH